MEESDEIVLLQIMFYAVECRQCCLVVTQYCLVVILCLQLVNFTDDRVTDSSHWSQSWSPFTQPQYFAVFVSRAMILQ